MKEVIQVSVCQDVPGAAPPLLPVIIAVRGHVGRLSATG